ncbi:hypothetical protein FQN57_002841 [Myotisia sp. PD_48]|nr:hypothetical protein FQN57_002841 [Myotisia sp. PD_48]
MPSSAVSYAIARFQEWAQEHVEMLTITLALTPYPCPGPDAIQCCIKYANMHNGSTSIPTSTTIVTSIVTSSSNVTDTAITSTTEPGDAGHPPPAKDDMGKVIGASVGGACFLIAIILCAWGLRIFLKRRKEHQVIELASTSKPTTAEMPDSAGTRFRPTALHHSDKPTAELDGGPNSIYMNRNAPRELESNPIILPPAELDGTTVEKDNWI